MYIHIYAYIYIIYIHYLYLSINLSISLSMYIYIYIYNKLIYIYYINLCANRIACVCYFMLTDYNEIYRERYIDIDIDIINRYIDI